MSVLSYYMTPAILSDDYVFSSSGLYRAPPLGPLSNVLDYFGSLPISDNPEVFGMHDNANITCAITVADSTFSIILTLQPRVATGTGISREDQIIEMAKNMASQLPPLYDIEAISMLYPTDYYESMNTVLVQEAQRYNKLLHVSPFYFCRTSKI